MGLVSKIISLVLVFCVSGCATLDRFVDSPVVSIANIEMLPTQGLQPRFAVDLNILNPNPVAIPITGMAYEISLNGYDLFSGATSDVPRLPAYEEVPLRVEVGANVLQSFGLIMGLLNGEHTKLDYVIETELKVSGILRPFTLVEKGVVDLNSVGN